MRIYQQKRTCRIEKGNPSGPQSVSRGFSDNRENFCAQKKLIAQIRNETSSDKATCVQGVFVDAYLLTPLEMSKIRDFIRRFRPADWAAFSYAETSLERFSLDEWLTRNIGTSLRGILVSQRAWDDQMRLERRIGRDPELMPRPEAPSTYGEEDFSGPLAFLRAFPVYGRLQNRFIATTVRDSFPDDEATRRNIEEFIIRGGEVATGVDVMTSIYDQTSPLPPNVTYVHMDYPRVPRGTTPGTGQVTSGFVKRASEVGGGSISIPVPAMYGGNAATRDKTYGSRMFESTMEAEGMKIVDVRPGPEKVLGVLGYHHRKTGKEESREGLEGKTMTLAKGDGDRRMDTGD